MSDVLDQALHTPISTLMNWSARTAGQGMARMDAILREQTPVLVGVARFVKTGGLEIRSTSILFYRLKFR